MSSQQIRHLPISQCIICILEVFAYGNSKLPGNLYYFCLIIVYNIFDILYRYIESHNGAFNATTVNRRVLNASSEVVDLTVEIGSGVHAIAFSDYNVLFELFM